MKLKIKQTVTDNLKCYENTILYTDDKISTHLNLIVSPTDMRSCPVRLPHSSTRGRSKRLKASLITAFWQPIKASAEKEKKNYFYKKSCKQDLFVSTFDVKQNSSDNRFRLIFKGQGDIIQIQVSYIELPVLPILHDYYDYN